MECLLERVNKKKWKCIYEFIAIAVETLWTKKKKDQENIRPLQNKENNFFFFFSFDGRPVDTHSFSVLNQQ